MTSLDEATIPSKPELNTPSDWRPWYQELNNYAFGSKIWSLVNPDSEDHPDDDAEDPEWPTLDQAKEELKRDFPEELPTLQNVNIIHSQAVKKAQYENTKRATQRAELKSIFKWINATVNTGILNNIYLRLHSKGTPTIKQLIREIKMQLAPKM